MRIRIEDMADAFAVVVEDDDGGEVCYYFDQEDTREELVDLFKSLGFDAYYQEVC